jgi:transposase
MERVYVGVDWADDHHDVHVTNDSGINLDNFRIPHSHAGVEKLKSRLIKFSSSPGNIFVAIESHHGLLIYALLEAGYVVYPINPKAVDRYRDRLRELTRAHKSLVQQKVKLVNQLTVQLKHYYPVVLRLFSDLDQEVTLAFLERYPAPVKATTASLKELKEFFRQQKYSHPSKVPLMYQLLQQPSLRAPDRMEDVHRAIVLSLIPVLRTLLAEIAKLAKEISKEFKKNPANEVFSSLPTGEITAARLNGELGSDGQRYPTREYLQTAAGTAPVTRRSGKSKVVFFRWQCNKHLRYALQSLARGSVMQCPWARNYFIKQIKLGHKPSRAYRALANRWAAIVWKMLQERQCFDQARLAN